MRWFFLLFICVSATLLAAGCASTDESDSVSSIPWNRPQSWEGKGPMGGAGGMPGTGGSSHY